MISLFVPLLIYLRTTYHSPQFPPVKKETNNCPLQQEKYFVSQLRYQVVHNNGNFIHCVAEHNCLEGVDPQLI